MNRNGRVIIAEVQIGNATAVVHRRMTVEERMARDPWYVKALRYMLRKAYKAIKWTCRNKALVLERVRAALLVLATVTMTVGFYCLSRASNPFHEGGFLRGMTSLVQAVSLVGLVCIGFVVVRDWVRDFITMYHYAKNGRNRHQEK